MAKKLYNAIIFMDGTLPPRKYRNISNINSFINFCKSIDCQYINLYNKDNRLFVERIYIKKGT